MGLPPIETDVWWSLSVFCMIFSRNKLNRMGENKHPWWTPPVVLKNSSSWLFKRTALLEFSHSTWMAWTSSSSTLKLLRTCHRPAFQTLSNIFLKSWSCGTDHAGVVEASLWLLDYWRSVLLCSGLDLKPAWYSASSSSALALSQLRITQSMILLGWLIRLMVR